MVALKIDDVALLTVVATFDDDGNATTDSHVVVAADADSIEISGVEFQIDERARDDIDSSRGWLHCIR